MRTLLALMMALSVSACVHAGAADTKCLTEKAVRLTDQEIAALSPETARQILANNEDGAKRCGWKANR